ncbi:hypothetical protein P12x_004221 [Tundrisphaera lichenicola]|uniref:hypothetical protein n=1 Tax=Tundrisphaera lichenicola TaxID=2029860 RepID=UPI003EB7F7FF
MITLWMTPGVPEEGFNDRLWESIWFGAQYGAALWAVVAILVAYWNCFEVYWDLIWQSPILAIEIGLLLGMALGLVLPGYGLINLFWGDGSSIDGAVIVPVVSASMIVLTISLFLLLGYFSSTIVFDQSLDGRKGMSRDHQISHRVNSLWRELLPDPNSEDHYRREPGSFVWLCLRPILLLLAIPAVFPALAVDRLLDPVSRGGWIAGLSLGGLLIRSLVIDCGIVRWVAEMSSSNRPKETDLIPVETKCEYPLTVNLTGLSLIVIPILNSLLIAHTFDVVRDYQTRPCAFVLVGLLTIVNVVAIWRLHWPSWVLRKYAKKVMLILLVPAFLALIASWLGGHWIAAPFSISWLIMFLGFLTTTFTAVVSGFVIKYGGPRRERAVRRGIQLLTLFVLLVLLWQNGMVEVRGMTTLDVHKDLSRFDVWFEGYMTDGTTKLGEFGSPQLKKSSDRLVLERWKDGARRASSDVPMPVGTWVVDPENRNRAMREVDRKSKPKLIVVAVSGGGLRAGIWAEKVLYELERAIPEFPDRTRLITGSSGGMLGAARYVAGLTPAGSSSDPGANGRIEPQWAQTRGLRESNPGDDAPESHHHESMSVVDQRIDHELHKDFLTPVIHRLVFGDVDILPMPGMTPTDRGMVLEEVLREEAFREEDQPGNHLNKTFKLLAEAGETQGRLPSLVFSPVMVEDSRRLIVSNLDLGSLMLNHGSFDLDTGEEKYESGPDFPYYSTTGVQLFHLFPKEYDHFTLAKAVRMNATFPYVTPAVSMPTLRPRRVVDAGYYDNYGIDLAVGWLEEHRRWLELNTSGVILIQLRAFSNETLLKRLVPSPLLDGTNWLTAKVTDPLMRGTEFLTTPLSGIGNARMNVNYYRNDAAVENLKRSFTFDMLQRLSGAQSKETAPNPDPGAPPTQEELERQDTYSKANSFFRVITFTCSNEDSGRGALPIHETLSWYLGDLEFKTILQNWKTFDNYRRFQYLRTIFRKSFEVDQEANGPQPRPESGKTAEREGWIVKSAPVRQASDPHSSIRGKNYLVAEPSRPGERLARIRWTFDRIPQGTYKVSFSLPILKEIGLPKVSLADRAKYTISVDAQSRPRVVSHSDRAVNPDDMPNRDDFDASQVKESVTLGFWSILDPALEVTSDEATIEIELTNESADGLVIADAIRLDAIQGD